MKQKTNQTRKTLVTRIATLAAVIAAAWALGQLFAPALIKAFFL